MDPDPSVELTDTITQLQDLVLAEDTATEAVACLTEGARELIPMAAGAGITVVDEHGMCTTIAATDPAVAAADALQYELGEGPCLRAWDTATTQRIPDTTTDARWPEWSQAVAQAGIRSVLSTPLACRGREVGALKIYATEPHAFTDYDEHLLDLLACTAAPLLGAIGTATAVRRLSAELTEAAQARGQIERAVGVLMERHHLNEHTARTRLLAAARTHHQLLAQTAENLLHGTDHAP
jgi:GAF domain-containing protein